MKIQNRLKSLFAAGLVGLVGLTQNISADNADLKITGSLTEKYSSRYVMGSGSILSAGPVLQDTLKVGVGKYVAGWISMNHDLTTTNGPSGVSPNLVSFAPEINLPLTKNLTLKQDIEFWNYPEHILGKQRDVLTQTAIKYQGPVTASAAYIHFMPTDFAKQMDRVALSVSKPIKVYTQNDLTVTATPSVTAVYQDNHKGNHGIYHETAGFSLSAENKQFGIEAFVNRQNGNADHGKKDITYGGISAKLKF